MQSMGRRIRILGALLAVTLSGCAGGQGYPSLANIQQVATEALTPDQQKAVINDLRQTEKAHRADVEETVTQ